jgi:hypothetical protein
MVILNLECRLYQVQESAKTVVYILIKKTQI